MQGWNKPTLILILSILIVLPLVVESRLLGKRLRQSHDSYELSALYECYPLHRTYRVDFNNDGYNEYLLVENLPGAFKNWLTVVDNTGRVFVRLPFNNIGTTRGTHVAIVNSSGAPHLLIYDAVNYYQPLKVVYAFDGQVMSQISATVAEREILSAMAARDGVEEWSQRDSTTLYSLVKLGFYYFVLAIIILVVLHRRFAFPAAYSGCHFLRGTP